MNMDEQPVRVVRHQSDWGEWELIYRRPHPQLRPYIAGDYQGYVEPGPGGIRRREVPSGNVPLILTLAPADWLIDPADPAAPTLRLSSFVAGLHDSHVLVESTGPSLGMQVNFTPIGAHRFFGLPMDSLTNRIVAVQEILGLRERRLVEQLRDAPTWRARFDLLDAVILARLDASPEPAAGVLWAWRQLNDAGGCLNIGELAGEIGWSRKHLVAQFHQQIGLPPKTVARILRFSRALQRLETRERVCWADIAHDCGYYDQAHFIRDFRKFAGSTPSDFLALRAPDEGGLIER